MLIEQLRLKDCESSAPTLIVARSAVGELAYRRHCFAQLGKDRRIRPNCLRVEIHLGPCDQLAESRRDLWVRLETYELGQYALFECFAARGALDISFWGVIVRGLGPVPAISTSTRTSTSTQRARALDEHGHSTSMSTRRARAPNQHGRVHRTTTSSARARVFLWRQPGALLAAAGSPETCSWICRLAFMTSARRSWLVETRHYYAKLENYIPGLLTPSLLDIEQDFTLKSKKELIHSSWKFGCKAVPW